MMYLWEGAFWCASCVRRVMAQLLLETKNDMHSTDPGEWPQQWGQNTGVKCEGCGGGS